MFVMTIDQRRSRRDIDRVDDLLAHHGDSRLIRGFERTAGDEVQAISDDPGVVARIAIDLVADGHWSVGIGIGEVESPLPASTRAGRGPAFLFARDAVDAAKNQRVPIAVRGGESHWSVHAETAARLFGDVVATRSVEGTAAVAAMAGGATQAVAARTLGISPQAMSQRLRSARWDVDDASYALITDLLAVAAR